MFGDSYACLTLQNNAAWFENEIILEKYKLMNFAKKGSDITYSFKMFIDNHHRFSKNIFFVTESTRHTFNVGRHTFHVSNLESIDIMKNNLSDYKLKSILNSLKDHYLYSMSLELYDYGLAGMVEKIKEIRPDTVIIYGFYNHSIKKITGEDFYLSQVSLMELDEFGIDFQWMKKTGVGEGRSAHLTDENNIVFAQYIRARLDGYFPKISLEIFHRPNPLDKLKYFNI